jgi:hypothetical protein
MFIEQSRRDTADAIYQFKDMIRFRFIVIIGNIPVISNDIPAIYKT